MRVVALFLAAAVFAQPSYAAITFKFMGVGEAHFVDQSSTEELEDIPVLFAASGNPYVIRYSLTDLDGNLLQSNRGSLPGARSEVTISDGLWTIHPPLGGYSGNGVIASAIGRATDLTPIITNTALPEPSTWAMLLIGFGAIGAKLRYRSRAAATFLSGS